jgi:hypothetical protein
MSTTDPALVEREKIISFIRKLGAVWQARAEAQLGYEAEVAAAVAGGVMGIVDSLELCCHDPANATPEQRAEIEVRAGRIRARGGA